MTQKTHKLRIGGKSFEVRGNKMLGLKNYRTDSLLGVAEQINREYTPQHGITRNALIKMVIRGLDTGSLFSYFDYGHFDYLHAETEETVSLAKKLGMSKTVFAGFRCYMECTCFSLNNMREIDRKLYKETRAMIAGHLEKILGECGTSDETLNFFKFLRRGPWRGETSVFRPKLKKLLKELAGWFKSATWQCSLRMMEREVPIFIKLFIKTGQLLAPSKKIDTGQALAQYIWVNKNRIMAYGDNETRYPVFVKTSMLDLFAKASVKGLEIIINTAETCGVEFKTLMAQCMEEVNSGADVTGLVRTKAMNNLGIGHLLRYDDYNDVPVSQAEFERIWRSINIGDFMDKDGFIRDRDSEIRELLSGLFSHATFEGYKNGQIFMQSIKEDYKRYCMNKLGEYMCRNAENFDGKKGGKAAGENIMKVETK